MFLKSKYLYTPSNYKFIIHENRAIPKKDVNFCNNIDTRP